jgi:hypothetical protein
MKWFTPVRFANDQTYAWCKTKERSHGLPVYALKKPATKDKVLSFPMHGNAKGCVQVMDNPKVPQPSSKES